jgi:hypothetical protein
LCPAPADRGRAGGVAARGEKSFDSLHAGQTCAIPPPHAIDSTECKWINRRMNRCSDTTLECFPPAHLPPWSKRCFCCCCCYSAVTVAVESAAHCQGIRALLSPLARQCRSVYPNVDSIWQFLFACFASSCRAPAPSASPAGAKSYVCLGCPARGGRRGQDSDKGGLAAF